MLSSINIPKSLNAAGYNGYNGIFFGCSNLKNVTFESGITKVISNLFAYSGLEHITIPDTVTEIGSEVFEGCDQLKSITLSAGLETIGYNAFYGCSNDLAFYCPKYSYPTIYFIDNGYGSVSTNDVRLEETAVLNETESHFTVTSGAKLRVSCTYSIKDEVFETASDYSIKIRIPNGAEIEDGSLYMGNTLLTEYTEYDEYISVPVSGQSGKITFNLETEGDCKLRTYAVLNYTLNGRSGYDIIDVINEDVDLISLDAEDVASSAKVKVSGVAPVNASVDIYADDEKLATLKANKAGIYSGEITLTDPVSDTAYTVKAVSQDNNGDEISAEKKVTYIENAPELTDFTMKYNGGTYDLMSGQKNSITFRLESFHGETPFHFEAKYENHENIGKVYISSTRNQVKKTVTADWNEAKQAYVFNGYFDDDDHDYVPGKIEIAYTKQWENNKTVSELQSQYNAVIAENPGVLTNVPVTTETKTDGTVEYTIDPSQVSSLTDLASDLYKVSVKSISKSNDIDWYSYASSSQDIYSYFFDKEGEKYFLTLDYSDPKTYVMIVDDLSSNAYVEYAFDRMLASSSDKVAWAGANLTAFNEVLGIFGTIKKGMDISDDYDDLVTNIYRSGMTSEEKSVALQKAKELKRDREMYLLATTLISIATAGTGGLPFALMMGTMGAFSDYFFEMRAAGIMSGQNFGAANWSIDPSGYIYSGIDENRVQGATVTAYWIPFDEEDEHYWDAPDESKAVVWDSGEYSQINPLITDNDGNYAWDVPEGWWRVVAEKDGYITYTSEWLPVPPPQTEVNIDLRRIGDVTGNGSITIEDVTFIQRCLCELIEPLSEEQIPLADVNKDGEVNIIDATLMQMYAAELIDHF